MGSAQISSMVRHVLGVFAQPKVTQPLRLQSEQREISQCLLRSRYRDSITFDALAAATIDDLRRALLARTYDVVHFAGHGDFVVSSRSSILLGRSVGSMG